MISNYDSQKYDSNRYEKISDYYNELMLSGYYDYDKLVSRLCDILDAHGAKKLLELGIGTGLVASRLVQKGRYALTGVDFSPSMIELCDAELKRRVNVQVMDVVDLDLGERFDAIYCVGGAWYFIDNKQERDVEHRYQLCSHIPDPEKQMKSFRSVERHLVPGGILILSIQGPHHDFEEQLPSGLIYRQEIVTENVCFEKSYIFKREGEVVARQECLYRLTELHDAARLFHEAGLEIHDFDSSGQYVVLRKPG